MQNNPAATMPSSRKLIAYTAPYVAIVLLFAVGSLVRWSGWIRSPEFWIYPIQAIASGVILIFFWREYEWERPAKPAFTIVVGILVFVIWIAPQQFLQFAPRPEGFNPDVFAGNSAAYWGTVIFRFLRLVIVVPLAEEIFWRGFLLRYPIKEEFEQVPFGTFSWLSFAIVTLLFGLSHLVADWPVAVLTGAIYNGVAYRTKSLSACVFAHAITNLLLGLWIMQTKEWGFW
jgi:CAAX prenyl protease-like protein